MSTDVKFNSTEITTNNSAIDVSTDVHEIDINTAPTTVEGYKKEYSIVGDGLYASISYDEAPTWLTSIIDTVVNYAIEGSLTNYASLTQDIRDAISMLDVAANSYVEEINFASSVDEIVASHLTTLNATLENTYATLVELDTMVANTEYALAIQVADLRASYTDDINSEVTAIRTAFANADSALASDITALTSVFTSQESNISGMSDAVTSLQTYVGLTESSDPDGTGLLAGIEALSTWLVNLENEVTGDTGHVAVALSTLETSSRAYADDIGASAENKFAYNSVIALDEVYYTSGFGLIAVGTTGTGTEGDPYNSEFWINAEKLKFTNGNQTGATAPFTIDASGTTPRITFNGFVSFNNVNGTNNLLSAGDSISSLINNVGYTDDTAADAAQATADSALAAATNIDVSSPIASNNEVMAQKLGYDSYAALVAFAESGQTIISGGAINTSLLTVQTALVSSDGLFSVDMNTKLIKAEAANGDYSAMSPGYIGTIDAATGDYLVLTAGTAAFVDASNAANNLTWENGTLTLPNACVNTLHIKEDAVVVPVGASAGSYVVAVSILVEENYAVFIQGSHTASRATTLTLTRNGTTLWVETPNQYTLASRGCLDYPGIGTHVYKLEATTQTNTNNTSLYVQVVKR